jgi:hypothetical protein
LISARSEKGHIVTSTFWIPEVRESRGRGDLASGKPKTRKSKNVWRKLSFQHFGVWNFRSSEDMRTKHFSIRKPKITKGGESREIGILEFHKLAFSGVLKTGSWVICIDEP